MIYNHNTLIRKCKHNAVKGRCVSEGCENFCGGDLVDRIFKFHDARLASEIFTKDQAQYVALRRLAAERGLIAFERVPKHLQEE